jgi:hypothetical protein
VLAHLDRPIDLEGDLPVGTRAGDGGERGRENGRHDRRHEQPEDQVDNEKQPGVDHPDNDKPHELAR